jgi:hypothetical protein
VEEQEQQPAKDQANPDGLLYHYTDQKGLMGILESDCLWATHYRFLNDASERQGALEFFVAIDQLYSKKQDTSPSYWAALRASLEKLAQLADPYFVSFSEEGVASQFPGDRLSQWRGYALNRQGFSLGFESEYLRKLAGKLTTDLGLATLLLPCAYDDEIKAEIVRDILQDHAALFNRISLERITISQPKTERIIDDPAWRGIFRELQTSFLNYSSQFKHEGFKEENEWRLVLYVLDGASRLNSIEFRDGPFGRTPFIKLPIGLKEPDSPLRRIVVGPSQNKEQIVFGLRLELVKMGIHGVEVVPSKIPYRNW